MMMIVASSSPGRTGSLWIRRRARAQWAGLSSSTADRGRNAAADLRPFV